MAEDFVDSTIERLHAERDTALRQLAAVEKRLAGCHERTVELRAKWTDARVDANRLAAALRRVSWDDGSISGINLHQAGRCIPNRCMYHAKEEAREALRAHDSA